MCARYYIPEEDPEGEWQQILEGIRYRDGAPSLKRGEIFPADIAPVLANSRSLAPGPFAMRWGYRFPGGKTVINARWETASAKPLFRDGMRQRRCLVPAVHYYEWEKRPGKRIKYAIRPRRAGILLMAGLYRLEGNEAAFTILTRDASAEIAFIHSRMPVILPPSLYREWLNVRNDAEAVLQAAELDMQYRPADEPR